MFKNFKRQIDSNFVVEEEMKDIGSPFKKIYNLRLRLFLLFISLFSSTFYPLFFSAYVKTNLLLSFC